MSVIDSLSAGYRFVTGKIYLLLIPVVLDLLLWIVPRISIAPLLAEVADLYRDSMRLNNLPADMATIVEQASTLLEELGRQSNLLNLLVNSSLLHVPSIVVQTAPLSSLPAREISSPLLVLTLFICFSLLGLFIGAVYFGQLADRLPIGAGNKSSDWNRFVSASSRRWWRIILFVLAVLFILFVFLIPTSLGITVIALLSPAFASTLVALLSGLVFVGLFYLYFATAGLVMDDLTVFESVSRSIRLVRKYFWSSLGFIILINLISLGIGLLLMPLTNYGPVGILFAIVVNAYIGTGLAMALLVFYRTRTLIMEGDVTLEELLHQQ